MGLLAWKSCILGLGLLCSISGSRTRHRGRASGASKTSCTPPLVRCAHDPRYCCSVAPQVAQAGHQVGVQQHVPSNAVPVMQFQQMHNIGEAVEYQSSQGWIPAVVTNFYPATGQYDLNIRTGIPWEKVRKPPTLVFQQQFQNGQDVEYQSSKGWIPAKVAQFYPATGHYDLNVRADVPLEKLRKPQTTGSPQLFQNGEVLEYQSSQGWIPAQVVRFHPSTGHYDLNIRADIPPHKLRRPTALNPQQALASEPPHDKAEGQPADDKHCQYYPVSSCSSLADFKNGRGSIFVWLNCPKHCAKFMEENELEVPEMDLRVIDCLEGGYTDANPPKHTWNAASGEYWETCVSHVDISEAKSVYLQNPVGNWFQAASMVLNKVYPVGAQMWQFQKQKYDAEGNKNVYFDGVLNFLKITDGAITWIDDQREAIRTGQANPSFEKLIQINTAVHENCHRHHSTLRGFRPLNTWEPFFPTPSVPNPQAAHPTQFPMKDAADFIKEFPRRWEIYEDIPQWTRSVGITDTYFPDHDAKGHVKDRCGAEDETGPNGCARIAGLLSEAECYIHGIAASLWTSRLGRGFTPQSEVNEGMEGAVFPLAYWQHVHVLYLQHMKNNPAYSVVWSRLVGKHPSQNLPNVAKIFLAHYDRTKYLLSMSNWVGNYLQERTLQMMKLTTKKVAENDVISDLRAQFR